MAPYPKFLKKNKNKSPVPSTTTFKRSPLLYRGRVARNRNAAAPEPRAGLRYEKHLPTIPEHFASPDRDRRRSHFSSAYYDPFPFDADQDLDEEADEDDFEPPTFNWVDEETLVEDLSGRKSGTEQDDEDVKLNSLADSIQTSFTGYSKELIADVADNLVPAVNCVRRAYQVLNDQVDDSFALGVLEFDEACQKFETIAISGHNELKKACNASKARIQDLLKQLEEAHVRRDQLWVDFEKALDEIINPAIDVGQDASS
ncbi:hypothetical protein BT96DRAFT_1022698 [Gymnopus androsaceus JB14]|uniref:Uncharacterized protein n=1 Tax=Gymnopus androsaceus JB14 TaxID=1447944 RepID=A0A6A4H8N4_9AGAR|nr:hypothetical protein BT96DRAFT_1022698 [Gymnopus androsaceus JB14]